MKTLNSDTGSLIFHTDLEPATVDGNSVTNSLYICLVGEREREPIAKDLLGELHLFLQLQFDLELKKVSAESDSIQVPLTRIVHRLCDYKRS